MHIQKAQFPIGEETNPSPKPGTLRVQTEFNPEIYTQFQTHFTVQIPQTTSSSPTNPSPKPKFNPESYTHFISDQRRPQIQTHLTVQIPQTTSSSPTNRPTQFHHEPISHNSPTTQTLRSTPHKRPVMAQTPYPTPSSSRDRPQSALNSKSPFFPCSAALAISFFKKSLVLRCCRHMCCARLLRFHLQFLVLLSLPSLYLFLSNPRRSYALDVLSLLAFASVILISLNVALPRLPSIRLFLARSLPIKFSSSPAAKPAKPVVWSIGSKPKSERHANSGSWVKVYSNGDVYEGEFHKGKCSGSGVYYYNMKGRYEGDWVDEKYDGYGVETWARGSRYRGQYRQGLRHGIGVYRFYTGDVYSGEWSNGQCHGCGVHTCEDGSRYVGEFKWGVKHGLGHYHFRNGDTYSGEYFADKMHGFGIYRFGNGHQYEGAWHEGRRQGLGMYTFRNGETQSGHWQNGVLNALSAQNPGSPYAVEHSKVLNVIQEAQQVAARARNLGGVDDRVNRAVAAANKAAHAARVAAIKAVQKQMHSNNYIDGIPIAF